MERPTKAARSRESWAPRYPADSGQWHPAGGFQSDARPALDAFAPVANQHTSQRDNDPFYDHVAAEASYDPSLVHDGDLDLPPEDWWTSFVSQTTLLNPTRKRSHQAFLNHSATDEDVPSIRQHFPDYLARIPSPKPVTRAELEVENPYASEDGIYIHPSLQRASVPVDLQGTITVNGFIKARIHRPTAERTQGLSKVPLRYLQRKQPPLGRHVQQIGGPTSRPTAHPREMVHPLPPHFGDVRVIGKLDRMLFEFFTQAVCDGRTVIENDNAYLKQITPMGQISLAVKHAMLTVASSYVLDYVPKEEVKRRANYHYQRTVLLLGEELKNPENREPGNGDALIATLVLLGHTEVVNWEGDQGKGLHPKWYQANKLAEQILDESNPAIHFQSPSNVQFTRARSQIGIMVCLETVLSDCVYPLNPTTSKCGYTWLIQGTFREQRKIDGFAGLSWGLMHYLVKITHLSSRLLKHPSSDVIPVVGFEIEGKLHDFWQWSELSEGYETSQELLDSCELDESGKVTTRAKVTELVGESYVAAAQIYLQCRLFRRRRSDPVVQALLRRLLRTIEYQPTSGELFTAQTPLFSVVIGGIVAYKTEDRDVICAWFDPICEGSRGNVPPAYTALKQIWAWLDEEEDGNDDYDDGDAADGEVGVDGEDGSRGETDAENGTREGHVWGPRPFEFRGRVGKTGKGKGIAQGSGDHEPVAGDGVNLGDRDAWWEQIMAKLVAKFGRINLS